MHKHTQIKFLVFLLLGFTLIVQANTEDAAQETALEAVNPTFINDTSSNEQQEIVQQIQDSLVSDLNKEENVQPSKNLLTGDAVVEEEIKKISKEEQDHEQPITIPIFPPDEEENPTQDQEIQEPTDDLLATLQPLLPGPKNPLEPLGSGGEKGENWEKTCQGGTCTHTIYNYAKYYQQNGLWRNIDENFYSSGCQTGHDFCVIDNLYQVHMKSYLDAASPLTVVYGNFNLGFSPLKLSYRSNDQQQLIATIRHSPSQVNTHRAVYPQAFGTGIDMHFHYLPKQFKEDIIIRQRGDLPLINITAGTDAMLDLEFQMQLSGTATVLINNQLWDKQTMTATQGNIVIAQGTTKLSLPPPFALDAKRRITKATYVLEVRDSNLYITLQVPYLWLVNPQRVYPVLIDPTIVLGDAANQFDGSVSNCPICLPNQYARYPSLANVDIGQIDSGLGTIMSTDRATIEWDVSSLPAHAQIVDIKLTLNFTRLSSTDTDISFHHMEGNSSFYPDDNTNNQHFWNDLGNGTLYLMQTVTSLGFVDFNLSSAALDLKSALQSGSWWSAGMTAESDTVPATDYLFTSEQGGADGRAKLEIFYTSTKPAIEIIAPVEGTFYDMPNVTISVNVTDADNDTLKVSIFGANLSSDAEDLLLEQENVASATILSYSWEAPVLDAGDAALLMHFDNRSDYGEDDDSFNDFSSNNNDGSCSGAVCPVFTTGKLANAFAFTSPNHYITLQDTASLDITTDITLATWIKTNVNTLQHIIGGYQATDPFPGYSLAMSIPWLSAGRVAYWSDLYGQWVEGTADIADDQWHHVAVTVSGTTATFYVDGKQDGVVTSARPGSYQGVRAIGARADGDYTFTGTLDEVMIVPRALSEEDIKNLYRLQSGNYTLHVNVTDGIEDANSDFNLLTVFADEFEGRKAIEQGIINDLGTVSISVDQLMYTRNTADLQQLGRFDAVTGSASKRWGINYITPGEIFVNMSNLSTTVYFHELINLTGAEITQQVQSFISGTP